MEKTVSLSALKKYLPYGKIKVIAEKNGAKTEVDFRRAWDLLSERVKPKEEDQPFINDCIEAAAAEKARISTMNQRLSVFL